MAKDNNQGVKAVLQIRSTGSDARWKGLWKWLLAPSAAKAIQADVPESFEPKRRAGDDVQ